MEQKVAMILADGFEEIEAIAVIDVLRRADVNVKTYSLKGKIVHGAHGINIEADESMETAINENFTMVILPGGPGVQALKDDARVGALLEKQIGKDKYVAAICAAPTVLAEYGMLKGRSVTGYPGTEDKLRAAEATYTGSKVVVDEHLITSRGPGTAIEFGLEIVTALKGAAQSEWVREKLSL
ncbi:MAG: DJ-1/PfpI family protein [Proteobacteria bacterium]|nr:MAG: DJ-1/PfpI family protein [Pseudomonadota bacterium]